MNKQTKDQQQKLGQTRPSSLEEVNKQKQKAEKTRWLADIKMTAKKITKVPVKGFD